MAQQLPVPYVARQMPIVAAGGGALAGMGYRALPSFQELKEGWAMAKQLYGGAKRGYEYVSASYGNGYKRRKYDGSVTGRARFRGMKGPMVNRERRFVDYEVPTRTLGDDIATSLVDPASGVNCISAVAQGDGDNQRDGRKYLIERIQVRGFFLLPFVETSSGANGGSTVVRLWIVQDKQTNGAQYTDSHLFDANAVSSAFNEINCFRYLRYTSRFEVLHFEEHTLEPTNHVRDGSIHVMGNDISAFDIDLKKNIKVTCTGASADVASIQDNSIHVVAMCVTDGLNSIPTINYISRVTFVS